ncbi:MAG: hypothetical protein ABFR89_12250 [Actinomycetota bacterium]
MILALRRNAVVLAITAIASFAMVIAPVAPAEAVTGTHYGCGYEATSGEAGFAWAETKDDNNGCHWIKARAKYIYESGSCNYPYYTSWRSTTESTAYKTSSYGTSRCNGHHQVQNLDPLSWKWITS